MTINLCEFIAGKHRDQYATGAGTNMHERLRQIVIVADGVHGDAELAKNIINNPALLEYFTADAKTEVPVAGTVNGKFISRRIDRMVIDHAEHRIKIMDYKTDTDCTTRRALYKHQLNEYCDLMRKIYPDFTVTAAILWTHNWTLESI